MGREPELVGTSQPRLVGLKLKTVSGDSLPMSLLGDMCPTQGSQGRIEVEILFVYFCSASPGPNGVHPPQFIKTNFLAFKVELGPDFLLSR